MNIFLFLQYISIKKTGRYFASAKSVLVFSQKFLEYQKTKLFDFAQYFFNWICTSEYIEKFSFFSI